MKIKKILNKEGFTIVETMIVLAIAGLILLIVLLAVPALQRQSNNTNIKSDADAISSAINDFESNNGGYVPGVNNFQNKGSEEVIGSASGSNSDIKSVAKIQSTVKVKVSTSYPTSHLNPFPTPSSPTIYIVLGYTCSGETNSSNIAVFYSVQTSSGFQVSKNNCLDT